MIYIPDQWIVCTPTKSGTEALLSAICRRGGIGERIMPKHRITVPDEHRKATRILVVRNPWHRLVSMFYFLRKRGSSWGKGNYISFAEFLEFHQERARTKPSIDWTWNYSSIADVFKPKIVWRNETLASDVRRFSREHGLDIPSLTQVNVTHDRRLDYDRHYTKKLRQLVADWCEPDAERFGYQFGKD